MQSRPRHGEQRVERTQAGAPSRPATPGAGVLVGSGFQLKRSGPWTASPPDARGTPRAWSLLSSRRRSRRPACGSPPASTTRAPCASSRTSPAARRASRSGTWPEPLEQGERGATCDGGRMDRHVGGLAGEHRPVARLDEDALAVAHEGLSGGWSGAPSVFHRTGHPAQHDEADSAASLTIRGRGSGAPLVLATRGSTPSTTRQIAVWWGRRRSDGACISAC
jgi:hypothetical protein